MSNSIKSSKKLAIVSSALKKLAADILAKDAKVVSSKMQEFEGPEQKDGNRLHELRLRAVLSVDGHTYTIETPSVKDESQNAYWLSLMQFELVNLLRNGYSSRLDDLETGGPANPETKKLRIRRG